MSLWAMWLDTLRILLNSLAELGMGFGLAIIAGTIMLRMALLPIAWSAAYRGCIRQKKMLKLQPELQRLKDRHADTPDVYMQQMMKLYRKHELAVFDGRSLMGAVAQMPLFVGMFQVLRDAGNGARFLWIPDLLKPDAWLAIIAGATTALMIMVNPDIPEQLRLLMITVPSVVAIIAALNVGSALAIYWAASNVFSAVQTIVLHVVVERRLQAGTLKI